MADKLNRDPPIFLEKSPLPIEILQRGVLQRSPAVTEEELFETIAVGTNIRIEHIVSKGHTSPETGWHDQDLHEWVIVLKGAGRLKFDEGREVLLQQDDFINIPAHAKHNVTWTDPEQATIWLAVFYS